MKLWVDDVRPAPAGWRWAKTIPEAKRLLSGGTVTAASLDHDFRGSKTTGYDLLTWMHDTGYWPTEFAPRVHSGNVNGAIRMKQFIQANATLPPMPGRGAPPITKLSTGGSSRYHPRR